MKLKELGVLQATAGGRQCIVVLADDDWPLGWEHPHIDEARKRVYVRESEWPRVSAKLQASGNAD